MKRKDGIPLICSVTAVAVKDKKNGVLHYDGIVEDITKRKSLEEQLFQSQKMESIGRLAGGVAHDFNNILTSIMGFAEILKLKYDDATTVTGRAAEAIYKGSIRAANLTKQLLGFARGGKYESKPLDINNVIREIINMSEKIFEKSIDVTLNLDEKVKNIEGDLNQINQVFTNLIINAKDAMPTGGKLSFKTENFVLDDDHKDIFPDPKSGDYVKISVSDTGIGMSKQIKDNIFEPFFSTKGEGKGTGLGLATVYGIIKNHKGYIFCESEPGHGTTFSIYLPATEKKEIAQETKGKYIKGTGTILVVDDEEFVREMTKNWLKEIGYNVLIAENGLEAVDIYKIRKNEIDLILLDMIMPKMAGKETYSNLKKIDPDVKVIFMSGYNKDDMNSDNYYKDIVGFIQKPFRLEELSKIISDNLKRGKTKV